MAPVTRFEQLVAWQKARRLVFRVYAASGRSPFARDWAFSNQIRRAAVSTMANVAEGFDRARPREFQHFLSIAKGSSGEVRSHLYVAFDLGYLTEAEFKDLLGEANEVGRIVAALRKAVAGTSKARPSASGF
jgi:four helix bundle protein